MASSSAGNVDNKELFQLITTTLPNIGDYFKILLKKEKLSEEAESWRKKYETILSSLELGHVSGGRPHSIVADDDSGYYSSNRIRGIDLSESSKQTVPQNHSGFLLWQDEKMRWRRCWCRVEYHNSYLYIYDDSNEEVLLKSFSLENTSAKYEEQSLTETSERENSFVISGVQLEQSADSSGIDVYFAAYTNSERRKWTEILRVVSSSVRDSGRLSLSALDGHTWSSAFVTAIDSTSSSSNLSSNRDSMVSNSSSLVHRLSGKTDIGENVKDAVGEDKTAARTSRKQHPVTCAAEDAQQIEFPEDVGSSKFEDSGTIYESIDNLVIQFDDALRQIGENMRVGNGQPLTKKKKDKSQFPTKAKLLTDKKEDLEKGESYNGYMHMRKQKTAEVSWRKKWCVLRGCVFGCYKSESDLRGHEYVLLNGSVEEVSDGAKRFTFCLHCKGVSDMYFTMDEQESYCAWLEKLRAACSSDSYSAILQPAVSHGPKEAEKLPDSLYSVPRSLIEGFSEELYDVPRGSMALPSSMSANAAIDAGIYSVPRALLEGHLECGTNNVDESGNSFSESFNIYNFPRGSVSPDDDDEGIYDDPLDIVDMEIYDYPPDAAELGILDTSESNSHRNSSVSAASSDLIVSDVSNPDQLKTEVVPPVPSTSRPRLRASEQQLQDIRGSVISRESVYDHPRPLSEHFQKDHLATNEDSTFESASMVKLPHLSLEYGQCVFKGFLYKKERFMTWIKLFCVIRNSFLECHKYHAQGNSYSPVLKLFLPRSEVVEGGGDSKRKWAFQVKHPRREGILTFASENEEEYQQWIKAFQSGASIQVQSVNTVEEIRITDLDMQKRWTTTESVADEEIPTTADESSSLPPRSSTFSAGSSSAEDYNSDTLKRRRKFHWVKSTFMRRKTEGKMSVSQSELTSRYSNASLNVPLDGKLDPMRKSVSLEILPSANEDQEVQEFSNGTIKGYLCIQRQGADNTWVRYWCVLKNFCLSCYIGKDDLTLTLSIDLHGARISHADSECLRSNSLKILHSDSGQCLYLAAENRPDFMRWFSEITRHGREVISDDNSMVSGPFVSFYELPLGNLALEKHNTSRIAEIRSPSLQLSNGNMLHSGVLMKASHTGKWKKRFCSVVENVLHVSRSFADKVPIITLPLQSCSLELSSVSSSNKYPCQFKLKPSKSDKIHTFATETESELYVWIDAIRKASRDKSLASNVGDEDAKHGHDSTLTKRKSKKINDAELISHISATSIDSPDYAGSAFVQFGTEPWSQFWCVAYNNCLYIYETKTSLVTVKTVVLPGYRIGVRELNSTKYAHNLVLKHEGVSPVWMAFTDQECLEKWADIFYHYTRAEKIQQASNQSNTSTPLTHESVKRAKMSRRSSKEEKYRGKRVDPKDKHQKSIIHTYEKRIKKTQRVANQTELKLKKQQASLLHFKKELSRHVSKLDEWSTSGNEMAKIRLRKVQMKIAQVDKIVPYLEKYVAVNRQAESQTISVLRESCTMELRQHSLKYEQPTDSCQGTSSALPSLQTGEPSGPSVIENPYATLSDIRKEKELAESNLKIKSNYAELNFSSCDKTATRRPPSVNYVEVQLLSGPMSGNKHQQTDSHDRATSSVPQPDADSPAILEESQIEGHIFHSTLFVNSADDTKLDSGGTKVGFVILVSCIWGVYGKQGSR